MLIGPWSRRWARHPGAAPVQGSVDFRKSFPPSHDFAIVVTAKRTSTRFAGFTRTDMRSKKQRPAPKAHERESDTALWEKFALRHRGQPFLDFNPLYSLNESLITAIKSEVPGFFKPEQERFERDLAREASFAFFNRRVFGFSESDEASRNERTKAISESIDEMLSDENRRTGTDGADIQAIKKAGSNQAAHSATPGKRGYLRTQRRYSGSM